MAGGGGKEGEPEFQIAPMIDVLLVLLIFFMSITTAQVLKVDKSIQLPPSENALKKDTSRAETIVNVRWDAAKRKATYTLDDKVYNPTELTRALAEAKKAGTKAVARGPNPTFRCVIRGDRGCNNRSIALAMNAAADAGISDIAFSTVNRE